MSDQGSYSPPLVPDEQRTFVRDVLARALRASRTYDGKEASENKLFERLSAFEQCAHELAGTSSLDRDVLEGAISAQISSKRQPITVQDLLALAIRSFGKRFEANKLDITGEITKFCFLPTHGTGPLIVEPEGGHHFFPPRFEPRTRQLIIVLNQNGIYTDDLIIYRGTVDPRMMREQPYGLIQIPRLNREILICDEVEEATFIGQGLRGPLFWATYRKDQLEIFEDINRVIHINDWISRTLGLLLADNPPGPKISVSIQNSGYPLTEDLILFKALEYAELHDGKLPIQSSGEVAGLPGQSWGAWNQVIRTRGRGLQREGVSGLPDLFGLYGLKIRRVENPEAVREAIDSLRTTGRHNLVANTKNLVPLTKDVILLKALECAQANGGKLPTEDDGEIPGFPGQTWRTWNKYIRRVFENEKIKGTGHLYQLYGLRTGRTDNPETIRRAIENIRATGHHGLVANAKNSDRLTEDLILLKALQHAAANGGKLPSQHGGEVIGLPGQTWKMWDNAIRRCRRGLRRDGLRGLGDLYQLYGLKISFSENPEVITRSIENVKATGHHGLVVDTKSDAHLLSEDLVLQKILEYASANNGKLPTSESGDVPGFPGQTWGAWNGAVRHRSRGLQREGIKGLSHLYKLYGLKVANRENTVVIKQALENIRVTGHHGLRPVEGASVNLVSANFDQLSQN